MDRFEIVNELEGRYIPTPSGKYLLVKDGQYQTKYGNFLLLNYLPGTLEAMLEQSITQEDIDRETAERLTYLYTTSPPKFGMEQESYLKIACPTTKNEQEALDWFQSLEPNEVLAQLKFRYQDWYNEQQQALIQAGG